MKTPALLTLAIAICLFILTPGVLHAGSADEAINQLEQARDAQNPFPYVERAKHELEETGEVCRCLKWAAIRHLDRAVECILTIEPKAVQRHIERAIHQIKEGQH